MIVCNLSSLQNSIRHNLSIKKSMFQKVYLDPPRRGNGAYWTLLPEGQEEVQRCIKLFATLRPPVIDEFAYSLPTSSSSSTHTVRSKGQFVPARLSSHSVEVKASGDSKSGHEKRLSDSTSYTGLEHNLSKENYQFSHPPSIQPYNSSSLLPSDPLPSSSYHDTSSTTLLDSSFLTPLKEPSSYMQEVDINTISLSPLFNFIPPSTDARQHPHTAPYYGTHPSAATSFISLTPSKQTSLHEGDSGTFSPLGLKFCTPVKDLTTLTDLVQPASFSTPSRDLCSSLTAQELSITPTGTPGMGIYLSRTIPNSFSPLCFDGRQHSVPH